MTEFNKSVDHHIKGELQSFLITLKSTNVVNFVIDFDSQISRKSRKKHKLEITLKVRVNRAFQNFRETTTLPLHF